MTHFARLIYGWFLATTLLITAVPVVALELVLPAGATLTADRWETVARYAVPNGPYAGGSVPTIEIEGEVRQRAWRLPAEGRTSLQVLRPLRDQIVDAGYKVLLDCAGPKCGGFDFRFATEVLPAPAMFVDLIDYQFLSAQGQKEDGSEVYLTLLVSRVSESAYVQFFQVATDQTTHSRSQNLATDNHVSPEDTDTNGAPDLIASLEVQGASVLSDLEFATGSDALGPGPFASLTILAAYLREDELRRIAIVGHTDSVGSLENNIALSRRRAESVRARLIDIHGIAPERLEAGGMGYLAPITTNLTPQGREANRRVEAVLLNTE